MVSVCVGGGCCVFVVLRPICKMFTDFKKDIWLLLPLQN